MESKDFNNVLGDSTSVNRHHRVFTVTLMVTRTFTLAFAISEHLLSHGVPRFGQGGLHSRIRNEYQRGNNQMRWSLPSHYTITLHKIKSSCRHKQGPQFILRPKATQRFLRQIAFIPSQSALAAKPPATPIKNIRTIDHHLSGQKVFRPAVKRTGPLFAEVWLNRSVIVSQSVCACKWI